MELFDYMNVVTMALNSFFLGIAKERMRSKAISGFGICCGIGYFVLRALGA